MKKPATLDEARAKLDQSWAYHEEQARKAEAEQPGYMLLMTLALNNPGWHTVMDAQMLGLVANLATLTLAELALREGFRKRDGG